MDPDLLDERLRALAHPDRRRFLQQCREGARSAGELVTSTSLAAATVSEHLKVLRKSGLLVLERDGRRWMYTTDTAVVASVLDEVRRTLAGG